MQTKLFNETEYKQRAQLILQNIDAVQSDIEKFNKELRFLGEKLDKTSSFSEFFNVVDEFIKAEAKLDQFLLKEMKGLNKNVKDIIMIDVKDKTEFQAFANILSFNQIITDKILKNKERLSLELIKEQLTNAEYYRAKEFLHSITVLKPISALIEKEKTHFRTLLEFAQSMEQINELEKQIDEQDRDFLKAYQALIQFPKNEKTAGAVIEFLEKNHHVKAMMESFDFAESLEDDVLNAKVRISVSPSPGLN